MAPNAVAWVTTVEWQIAAVVRLSPENGAAALTQMPSTVAIGKIAHTVKRPDIIAIKTVRNAKVSAIFSCVREKSRLSFNGNGSCQYPGSKITALEASVINSRKNGFTTLAFRQADLLPLPLSRVWSSRFIPHSFLAPVKSRNRKSGFSSRCSRTSCPWAVAALLAAVIPESPGKVKAEKYHLTEGKP